MAEELISPIVTAIEGDRGAWMTEPGSCSLTLLYIDSPGEMKGGDDPVLNEIAPSRHSGAYIVNLLSEQEC